MHKKNYKISNYKINCLETLEHQLSKKSIYLVLFLSNFLKFLSKNNFFPFLHQIFSISDFNRLYKNSINFYKKLEIYL